jgi:hypothetical protein
MVPFADVSNTRGVSKSRGYDGAPAGKTNAGPCRKPHLAGGSPRIGRCCCSKRGNFSGSLVGRLSIYFGRGQRSRQKFGTLRQQINVLRRTAPKRLSFSVFDHLVFAGLYRLFPKICDALVSRQFGGNNRTHKQNTNDAHWDRHLNKCPLGCWIEPGATHQGPIKKLLLKENSARED